MPYKNHESLTSPKDESEIRVFTCDPIFNQKLFSQNQHLENMVNVLYGNPDNIDEYVGIKVDFKKLIEKIVITPSPEDGLYSKIENLLSKNNLSEIPVKTSKIE